MYFLKIDLTQAKYADYKENKDARETVVSWVYVWPFLGSDGAPNGPAW